MVQLAGADPVALVIGHEDLALVSAPAVRNAKAGTERREAIAADADGVALIREIITSALAGDEEHEFVWTQREGSEGIGVIIAAVTPVIVDAVEPVRNRIRIGV